MNYQQQQAEPLEHAEVLLLVVDVLEDVEIKLLDRLVHTSLRTLQRRKLKLTATAALTRLFHVADRARLTHRLFRLQKLRIRAVSVLKRVRISREDRRT